MTITVVNKDVEALREDFLTGSLAGQAPELLWTVADHVGPFTASSTVLPLDGIVDLTAYLPNAVAAVQAGGQTWGVPISFGNHLMLYTNKELVPECPADSDALIAAAKANTRRRQLRPGLSTRPNPSGWCPSWVGTAVPCSLRTASPRPSNTEPMINALTYLHGLKYTDQVMPPEADYNVADGMFKNGAAGATPSIRPSPWHPPRPRRRPASQR